jgi:hypothetical protein
MSWYSSSPKELPPTLRAGRDDSVGAHLAVYEAVAEADDSGESTGDLHLGEEARDRIEGRERGRAVGKEDRVTEVDGRRAARSNRQEEDRALDLLMASGGSEWKSVEVHRRC